VIASVGIAWAAQSKHETALPDIDELTCPVGASVAAGAAQPTSLPALVQLGTVESKPLPGKIVDEGHGEAGERPPLDIAASDRDAFSAEVRAASRSACSLQTVAEAERAGYVRSSVNTQGVGVHFTNWRLVDAPFDPAHPSMLLFGATGDGNLRLFGFSYWVRSATQPAAFAGSADAFHPHFGLCFASSGLLEREHLRDAQRCGGTWLNGSDLWMLHAWIVPGNSNTWGLFAPLNPALCARNVPDVSRCTGIG
jgi:hypothetical protein